jgi:hypothetical protein
MTRLYLGKSEKPAILDADLHRPSSPDKVLPSGLSRPKQGVRYPRKMPTCFIIRTFFGINDLFRNKLDLKSRYHVPNFNISERSEKLNFHESEKDGFVWDGMGREKRCQSNESSLRPIL